jgi:CRP-like cAMP-binding protein
MRGPMASSANLMRNRLLAALPQDEYARLRPELEVVCLQPKHVLAVPGEPIWHLYFPQAAVVSLMVPMEDGSVIESASIGNEGVVGLAVFLGDGLATEHMMVQISGPAARLPVAVFRQAVGPHTAFNAILHQYTLALLNNIARAAGCNRLHSVLERSARWLLMSDDRLGRKTFPLTHEALAILLGVRRASVSQAAETLQRMGLIRYERGNMSIVDRHGLEAAACEDYSLGKEAYDGMYR